VGAARITRIVDLEASGLAFLLPAATPDNLSTIEWIAPYLVSSGEAVAAIQSFVIEVGCRRVLVDTAAGERARSEIPARIELAESYLTDLEAAGFAPDTIDTVIHTHLHFDHVGYNLKPTGHGFVPTFPNARHLVVSNEWSHWSGGAADEERAPVERAIRPLMEAERVDLVAPRQEVAPGVLLEPTPGHTPGHVSVRIRSGAEQALISGDLMHHPAQLARPDWTCTWDVDPELARATRRRFLAECAASGALVIGTHFAHAPAGHVVRDGAEFRFEPSASAP
jgi:glyoxylase-like metal-dependent hydrolase (beta-lactamase superfamily II)